LHLRDRLFLLFSLLTLHQTDVIMSTVLENDRCSVSFVNNVESTSKIKYKDKSK